jgi:hypothetical protein
VAPPEGLNFGPGPQPGSGVDVYQIAWQPSARQGPDLGANDIVEGKHRPPGGDLWRAAEGFTENIEFALLARAWIGGHHAGTVVVHSDDLDAPASSG